MGTNARLLKVDDSAARERERCDPRTYREFHSEGDEPHGFTAENSDKRSLSQI